MASTSNFSTPFKYLEPVNKINGVIPGGIATIELPPGKRISTVSVQATVTKAAAGAGVTSIPTVGDIIQQIQFKVGGKPQRTRYATELFGKTGLNALNDKGSAGTVVYTQAGNSSLSVVPVLIGSADDLAQQALLTANAATTAVFQLPLIFAEVFRKEYAMADVMSLTQSFTDGSNIGLCTVELQIPKNDTLAVPFSGHNIQCEWEYDDSQLAPGTVVRMSKEYRHQVQYTAAGDIEVATQLYNRDILQRVSLLTTADRITRVVVKQGQRILRDITDVRNQAMLRKSDFNGEAIVSNRFDIEFDMNDDPSSAPVLTPTAPLSIVATLATANDTTKNIVILSSYYGPLD